MPVRAVSPRRARSTGRRRNNVNTAAAPARLNFSVQDRRLNTRLLNETQRRKAQLLGLTTHDVAHQLHRYTVEPTTVMDEGRVGGLGSTKGGAPSKPSGTGGAAAPSAAGVDVFGASSSPSSMHATADGPASAGRDAYARWQAQYAQHVQSRRDAAPASQHSPALPGGGGGGRDNGGGPTLSVPPTSSYDEWLSAGCPTGSWLALLHSEVYAPVEAERAFLTAKYDPKARQVE
ncbi:hypothetical protein NESM_000477700 [Novymonas esmeraldas]|uniref:Uncharacterized protein n=1 Tax=Novymonas esmeraldas TaxID=1808958 RepID=A0AAW0EPP4_9TRYP